MSDGKSELADQGKPSPEGAALPPSTVVGETAPPARPIAPMSSPATLVGSVPQAMRYPDPSASPATIVGTVPSMAGYPPMPGGPVQPPPYPTQPYGQPPPYAAAVPYATPTGTIPYNAPSTDPATGQPQPAWLGYSMNPRPDRWHLAIGFVKLHFSRAIARDLRSVDVAADESPILASHGVRDRTIQQYLLWRRSWLYLLLPLAFLAATIQMTSFFSETRDLSNFSWFGIIVLGTTFVLQMIGYPIAAALAVWKWDQARFSRWTLIIGWIASFLLPFLVALIPFGDFIVIEETDPDFIVGQKFGAGLVGATFWLFSLLPALLAIMPGILRACVRIKSLLPESIVPGWIIVMTAPFFTLVLLVVFVAVNQVAGNLLLVGGVLLIMASPAVFLIRTDLLVKPVIEEKERRRIEALQVVYVATILIGMALLLTYVFTLKVMGKPVVGNTEAVPPEPTALIGVGRFTWEVMTFLIAYSAKSVFVTAVAIDLFMMLNLSVWKNLKAFEGTQHAAVYDHIMDSFQDLVEGKDDSSRPFATTPTRAFEVIPSGKSAGTNPSSGNLEPD